MKFRWAESSEGNSHAKRQDIRFKVNAPYTHTTVLRGRVGRPRERRTGCLSPAPAPSLACYGSALCSFGIEMNRPIHARCCGVRGSRPRCSHKTVRRTQVDLLKGMQDGAPPVKLASLSSGDIFGESAMIRGGSRSATVRCATEVQASPNKLQVPGVSLLI